MSIKGFMNKKARQICSPLLDGEQFNLNNIKIKQDKDLSTKRPEALRRHRQDLHSDRHWMGQMILVYHLRLRQASHE